LRIQRKKLITNNFVLEAKVHKLNFIPKIKVEASTHTKTLIPNAKFHKLITSFKKQKIIALASF
jgi:hypothetical protein